MSEDRTARRNRNSPQGLFLLIILAVAAGALIVAAWIKAGVTDRHAREHIEADKVAPGEKSSTVSPDRISAGPLPVR